MATLRVSSYIQQFRFLVLLPNHPDQTTVEGARYVKQPDPDTVVIGYGQEYGVFPRVSEFVEQDEVHVYCAKRFWKKDCPVDIRRYRISYSSVQNTLLDLDAEKSDVSTEDVILRGADVYVDDFIFPDDIDKLPDDFVDTFGGRDV